MSFENQSGFFLKIALFTFKMANLDKINFAVLFKKGKKYDFVYHKIKTFNVQVIF